jgi:hypothetical protein
MACGHLPAHVTAIPLGRRLPGASSDQPGRPDPDIDPGARRSRARLRAVPIRSCSRWGLPCRQRYRRRGALLPHRFTLATVVRDAPRRSLFCGTFPGFASAGCCPAPLVRGARTFLPGNLSVPPKRPSDRLTLQGWGCPALASRPARKQAESNPIKKRSDQLTKSGATKSMDVRARAAMVLVRPRLAMSSCRVERVDASKIPSTRSGRK